MSKQKKYSKNELIKLAKECGFFNKPKISEIFARENGHFYYTVPPKFADGLETYKITRANVEPKKETPKKETPKKN